MRFYFVKTPKIIRLFLRKYLWKINTNKKEIYLTFDDGPTPEVTGFVLDILKTYKAKATFFCVGKNIKKHPDLFNRILDEGHHIGNHTFNHLSAWKTKNGLYIDDIDKCQNIINKNLSTNNLEYFKSNLKLFRPPYGKLSKLKTKSIIKQGYNIVMWTVLSGDFDQNLNEKDCLENVLKNTKSGSIVVLHDSKKSHQKLLNVLPKMITHFSSLGFKFKAI